MKKIFLLFSLFTFCSSYEYVCAYFCCGGRFQKNTFVPVYVFCILLRFHVLIFRCNFFVIQSQKKTNICNNRTVNFSCQLLADWFCFSIFYLIDWSQSLNGLALKSKVQLLLLFQTNAFLRFASDREMWL